MMVNMYSIVSRKTAPHLLKVSELKKGEIKPIYVGSYGRNGWKPILTIWEH